MLECVAGNWAYDVCMQRHGILFSRLRVRATSPILHQVQRTVVQVSPTHIRTAGAKQHIYRDGATKVGAASGKF